MVMEQLEIGYGDNVSSIADCEKTRMALMIDPGRDVRLIVDKAQQPGLDIETILNSHSHADHTAGHEGILFRSSGWAGLLVLPLTQGCAKLCLSGI
jgi:glyoxylase-like metal-dependent hydrolase (beta-lactamase superfamily II)